MLDDREASMILVQQQVKAEDHERPKMEQSQDVDNRASMRKVLDELERKTKHHLGLPVERIPLKEISKFLPPHPHLLIEACNRRGAVIDSATKSHRWLLQVSQTKSESYWDLGIRGIA